MLLFWDENKLKTQTGDPIWRGDTQVLLHRCFGTSKSNGAFLKSYKQTDLPSDPHQSLSCTNYIQNITLLSGRVPAALVTGGRPLKAALGNFGGVAFLCSLSDAMRP